MMLESIDFLYLISMIVVEWRVISGIIDCRRWYTNDKGTIISLAVVAFLGFVPVVNLYLAAFILVSGFIL